MIAGLRPQTHSVKMLLPLIRYASSLKPPPSPGKQSKRSVKPNLGQKSQKKLSSTSMNNSHETPSPTPDKSHEQPSPTATNPTESLPPLVYELNSLLRSDPVASFVTFTAMGVANFGLFYIALNSVGFDFPALAVGAVATKMLRYVKQPLDISLTVGVARLFPSLAAIQVGALLLPQTDTSKIKSGSIEEKWHSIQSKYIEGPINTYGAAFLATRVVTGLSTVRSVDWYLVIIVSWLLVVGFMIIICDYYEYYVYCVYCD